MISWATEASKNGSECKAIGELNKGRAKVRRSSELAKLGSIATYNGWFAVMVEPSARVASGDDSQWHEV